MTGRRMLASDHRGQPDANARPELLTVMQAAALCNVSERTFQTLRKEPWMPVPVVLGSRIVRFVRAELESAIANMPREQHAGPQPAQLLRGRIEALKRGSAGDSGPGRSG